MSDISILIVDDEPDVREIISRKLKKTYTTHTAESVDNAIKIISKTNIDLIITDLVMPQKDGLFLLKHITKEQPQIPVIVISGNATLSMAIKAMQNGAVDFIEKPIDDLNIISIIIEKALENSKNKQEVKRLKTLLNQDFDSGEVIGKSVAIHQAMEKVKRIANVDTTVLICGETGVGKDLFAGLIVKNSDRKNKRFVAVNCGSIPESLLESMLFGHKKGAFTSAFKDQIGYFEEANEGTIFLDEITETTPAFQTKLLRVLENRKIRKVGDNYDIPIDVRILTATNKNLVEEVQKGNFREDLFYRLNVIQINIPPLRERPEDVQVLAESFMKNFANKHKKPLYRIAPKTLDILLRQYWKGNVRELKNVIEHAVVMTVHDALLPEDLPAYILATEKGVYQTEVLNEYFNLEFASAKELFEKRYIVQLMIKTKGDVSQASQLSSIKRQNLYEKFKKYGIDPDKFRE